MLARLRCDLAEAAARSAGATLADAATFPPLWTPANMRPGYDAAGFGIPTYWVAHQGLVAHPSGSTTDLLLFDYPLTGTYELSAWAYVSPSAGSLLAHNGLAILPSADAGTARVNPLGESEIVNIPWRLSRGEGFNHVTVQASPQRRAISSTDTCSTKTTTRARPARGSACSRSASGTRRGGT